MMNATLNKALEERTNSYDVVLVATRYDHAQVVAGVLVRSGHRIVGEINASTRLRDTVAALHPQVVVACLGDDSDAYLDQICAVSRELPRPIVVFTSNTDAQSMRTAIQAGVGAYVIGAIAPERVQHIIEVAVTRFEAEFNLRCELDQARESLAQRKTIERAKGIVMKQRGCGEDEAYTLLRKTAMSRNVKVADIAQSIVTAAQVLM